MESKESFKRTLQTVISATSKTQEQIALELGYGKNYISEILSPTGRLTDKFLSAFHMKYGLENPNTDVHSKYVAALEELVIARKEINELKDRIRELDKLREIVRNFNSSDPSKTTEDGAATPDPHILDDSKDDTHPHEDKTKGSAPEGQPGKKKQRRK